MVRDLAGAGSSTKRKSFTNVNDQAKNPFKLLACAKLMIQALSQDTNQIPNTTKGFIQMDRLWIVAKPKWLSIKQSPVSDLDSDSPKTKPFLVARSIHPETRRCGISTPP